MSLELKIGTDAITSYKRLAYTAWHAMAEFVDNSTQSYFDNRAALDAEFAKTGEKLEVSIVYDRDQGFLRIFDNSIGMDLTDLDHALHVARPPTNTKGRSKYGMGMKTAACWIGNTWTIRTKKLGETNEYEVTLDVGKIAAGNSQLDPRTIPGKKPDDHYTLLEITNHNQKFQGRTIGKIKRFLASMYREDFRAKRLDLQWQHEHLEWVEFDNRLLKHSITGDPYKKDFKFEVNGKEVYGWVGILAEGSRRDAGFSILHSGRVVKGWPDSWRPESIYGQEGGSNDLVNQRLLGEIHLDPFDVSHTKDGILFLGDEEEAVEKKLLEACKEYRETARKMRKGKVDERGPTEVETKTALEELKRELTSPEMLDNINIETVPPEDAIRESNERVIDSVVKTRAETLRADIAGVVVVRLFLIYDISPNDPYVACESKSHTELIVMVNAAHPYWGHLKGSEGALNYLRHCIYDSIAEWQAKKKISRIDPDTIKLLKDRLLRVPMDVEEHEYAESQPLDEDNAS